MSTYSIGDVVELKSGSDPLTVIEIYDSGNVKCAYYFEGEYKYVSLPSDSVELGEDD